MDWTDEGLVLGARRLGDNDAVVELFTRDHGRTSGLVYGGAGKRKRAGVEPGVRAAVGWRARLDSHLGFFTPYEPLSAGAAALLDDAAALAALQAATSLLHLTTPEKHAYTGLYEASLVLLAALGEGDVWPALYVRWEAGVLAALGYGLDLAVCALTGAREDLAYVSPRTGRAASRAAGAPYADRLLALPPFLLGAQAPVAAGDVADGLALTGHFIETRLLAPALKEAPEARGRMIVALGRAGRL